MDAFTDISPKVHTAFKLQYSECIMQDTAVIKKSCSLKPDTVYFFPIYVSSCDNRECYQLLKLFLQYEERISSMRPLHWCYAGG